MRKCPSIIISLCLFILSQRGLSLVGGTDATHPPKDYLEKKGQYPNVGKGWFPSLALLDMAGEICTGTVVGRHHILTAAHCAVRENGDKSPVKKLGKDQPFRFYWGERWDEKTYTHKGTIYRILIHPSYEYSELNGNTAQTAADIALIILKEPILDIPYAVLDYLPFNDTKLEYAIKTGFGCESLKTKELFLSSNWQLKFDMDVKGLPSQEEAFQRAQRDPYIGELRTIIDDFYTATRGWYYDEEILAKPATLCSGDSGGPLYKFVEESGLATVAGINSRSRLKAEAKGKEPTIDKVMVDLHTRVDFESVLRIDLWLKRALAVSPVAPVNWLEGISFDEFVPRAKGFAENRKLVTKIRGEIRIPDRNWVVELAGIDGPCGWTIDSMVFLSENSVSLTPMKTERVAIPKRETDDWKMDRLYFQSSIALTPSEITFNFSPLETGQPKNSDICYVTTYVSSELGGWGVKP